MTEKSAFRKNCDLLIRFLLSGFLHQSNQPDLHLLQPFHLFISNIPLLHFQHLGIFCFALISHFRSFSNIHFCTYLPNLFSNSDSSAGYMTSYSPWRCHFAPNLLPNMTLSDFNASDASCNLLEMLIWSSKHV